MARLADLASPRPAAPRSLWRDDSGAAMVSFMLTFPIYWFILAVFVQLALLCVARLYVTHAAQAAGRSAVTALAEDRADRVRRAACMALTPLSPKSPRPSATGEAIAKDLARLHAARATPYAARYAFAEAATNVAWTPGGESFSGRDAAPVDVTVRYRFLLTVPVAAELLEPKTVVGGVSGRFVTFERTVRVERSPGRQYGRTALFALAGMLDQ